MQLFDVGGEFFVKCRFNDIEANRGEDARGAMEKKIKEFFGPEAACTSQGLLVSTIR